MLFWIWQLLHHAIICFFNGRCTSVKQVEGCSGCFLKQSESPIKLWFSILFPLPKNLADYQSDLFPYHAIKDPCMDEFADR